MAFDGPVRFLGMSLHCYAIRRAAWLRAHEDA